MSKKKIVILVISIILFIAALIGIYFLTTKDQEQSITGTVIVSGDNYIILESKNGDYLVKNTENSYELGDEVTITYQNSSLKETSPIEITATKEVIVKRAEKEKQKEEEEETQNENSSLDSNTDNSNSFNQTNSSNNQTTTNNTNQLNKENEAKNNGITNSNEETKQNNTSSNDNKSADEEVLTYVRSIKNDTESGITSTLKNGFITVVDFLFYDGEIAGHTFHELTTSAKLEVLKAALWIDDKVDQVFPGYKETISNGASKVYTSVKNLIVSTYLDITTSICENHSDLCTQAKEDFQDLKQSFGFTWDLIKSLASSGLDKLASWYEIWSGK